MAKYGGLIISESISQLRASVKFSKMLNMFAVHAKSHLTLY